MSRVRIRKIVDYVEDTRIEGGRDAARPLRLAACAAVIANPWFGHGFVEDLQPEILLHAEALGGELVPRLVDLLGGADVIEAFGKAAVVGTSGEIEQAAGLIHTLHFGNAFRMLRRPTKSSSRWQRQTAVVRIIGSAIGFRT